ncbi:MAG: hypothetical protein J7J91_04385 [Deltaproteobacteria bacterium]|nr:hypothetical protein [Deltaproteobacteria bacterium]
MGAIHVRDDILVSLKQKYGSDYSKVVNRVLRNLIEDEDYFARVVLSELNKAVDEARKYYDISISIKRKKKYKEEKDVELTQRELDVLNAKIEK